MTTPIDLTAVRTGAPALRRPRRALVAAGLAALLLAGGCGDDAVTDGGAPASDDEPPQDPRPQDNEQEAPNAGDADPAGDEEPGLVEGGEEDSGEQD